MELNDISRFCSQCAEYIPNLDILASKFNELKIPLPYKLIYYKAYNRIVP